MARTAFPLVMGILQLEGSKVGTDLYAMHSEVAVFPNKPKITELFQIIGVYLK